MVRNQASAPWSTVTGRGPGHRARAWVVLVVVLLLLLDVVPLVWMGVLAPLGAAALVGVQRNAAPSGVSWWARRADRSDLAAVGALYVGVVGLFSLAFLGFGTGQVAGLFLSFAAGLLLGVVGPIYYMVWRRGRSLADLGIGAHRLRASLALGAALALLQLAMTLWGLEMPAPVDWVPLLVMSVVVGAFEAVFFRGFVQGRLEESFGAVVGAGGAAVLYALYHVAYGMGPAEMAFLLGLGLVYAIAYRVVQNILVLWPLLTPSGAFFNNLTAGDIELPWASIAGFGNVAVLMAAAVVLAHRHAARRHGDGQAGPGQESGGAEARGRRTVAV